MTNRVSFIIQLKDQFGKVAAKVNRQFEGMKRKADKANRSITELVKKGQRGLGNLGKKAAKTGAIMTASLTVPIALMARAMITAASDAKETSDKFDAVFSGIKAKARSAAVEFAKTFKLANSTAQEMLGSTGDLLVGFGFTDEKALGLSKTISKMALDLAAFQNLEGGAPRASKALTSALSGETEGLKSLGIVVNQNDPAFKRMLKQNLRIAKGNIVQAKALTILTIAQNQTTKANDNYLLTLDTLAGLQRVNKEANKRLSESFGKLMLPIAIKLTTFFTKLADAVNRLSPGMKKTVLILAGLVAIGGPLLVVLGGIALAFSVISLPILAIGVAILGVTAIITAAVLNWKKITDVFSRIWRSTSDVIGGTIEQIGINFSLMWESAKAGIIDFVNFGINAINSLLAPLNFVAEKLGFDGINITPIQTANMGAINTAPIQAPSAPSQGASGTLNGQITVMAEPGTQVRQTSIQARGRGLNIGMNMAAT